MITDPLPRLAPLRAQYAKSDGLRAIDLPPGERLVALAGAIEQSLAKEGRAAVERACAALAAEVARTGGVAAPTIAVLGTRPHKTEGGVCVYEKFGDYDLTTARIRVWMRTAMRRQVTAFGTLLHTLCHELCHHLDIAALGFQDTPHTRGFYERTALLYHLARGTPAKRLVWVPLRGGRYRIDWGRTMRAS